MDILTDLLIDLGFKPNRQGFAYIEKTIRVYYDNPDLTLSAVYKLLKFPNSPLPGSIDSSIRNAVHAAQDSKKLYRLNARMKTDVIGEFYIPNSELIKYILNYLVSIDYKPTETSAI